MNQCSSGVGRSNQAQDPRVWLVVLIEQTRNQGNANSLYFHDISYGSGKWKIRGWILVSGCHCSRLPFHTHLKHNTHTRHCWKRFEIIHACKFTSTGWCKVCQDSFFFLWYYKYSTSHGTLHQALGRSCHSTVKEKSDKVTMYLVGDF